MGQRYLFEIESGLEDYITDNANYAYLDNNLVQNYPYGFKTLNDIYSIADFWSWMRLGFIPLLGISQWEWSENLQRHYAPTWDPDNVLGKTNAQHLQETMST